MNSNHRGWLRPERSHVVLTLLGLGFWLVLGGSARAQVTDPSSGHIYDIVATAGDWVSANQAANETTIGGLECHLVSITSQSEQDFLEANFDLTQTCSPSLTAWAGGFQDPSVPEPPFDAGWEWVTGEPFIYENWGGAEPNQAIGEEDCIELFPNLEWNDLMCTDIRSCYLIECEQQVVFVIIDIKPGSFPNCFNINGHGVIPVAILGSADLDVIQIDIESLLFAGLEVRVRGNRGPLCSYDYSNGDGYLDLVCHFEDNAEAWAPGDSEACVVGSLLPDFGGTSIEGCDSVCIVP